MTEPSESKRRFFAYAAPCFSTISSSLADFLKSEWRVGHAPTCKF
jgi:hypothetical protein